MPALTCAPGLAGQWAKGQARPAARAQEQAFGDESSDVWPALVARRHPRSPRSPPTSVDPRGRTASTTCALRMSPYAEQIRWMPLGGERLPISCSRQRNTVPRDEGQLHQRRRRPGEIPVEYPSQLIAIEAGVVRGDVIVADERGPPHARVPPWARVAESGHRLVEAACPRDERINLARCQQFGVDIDDPPGHEGENLTALPRRTPSTRGMQLGARGQVFEQRVNRGGPRPRVPVYRAADPATRHPHSRPAHLRCPPAGPSPETPMSSSLRCRSAPLGPRAVGGSAGPVCGRGWPGHRHCRPTARSSRSRPAAGGPPGRRYQPAALRQSHHRRCGKAGPRTG